MEVATVMSAITRDECFQLHYLHYCDNKQWFWLLNHMLMTDDWQHICQWACMFILRHGVAKIYKKRLDFLISMTQNKWLSSKAEKCLHKIHYLGPEVFLQPQHSAFGDLR